MKGTSRSLDFMRGCERINKNAARSRGIEPLYFKRLLKKLEDDQQ